MTVGLLLSLIIYPRAFIISLRLHKGEQCGADLSALAVVPPWTVPAWRAI